jgi:hypothetical protein
MGCAVPTCCRNDPLPETRANFCISRRTCASGRHVPCGFDVSPDTLLVEPVT